MQDRNNIGYARLLGLEKDLHMNDEEFDDAVMVFCKSIPSKAKPSQA